MLAESSFHPFRSNRPRSAGADWQHPVLGVSGDALSLRPAGQAAQQTFFDEVRPRVLFPFHAAQSLPGAPSTGHLKGAC